MHAVSVGFKLKTYLIRHNPIEGPPRPERRARGRNGRSILPSDDPSPASWTQTAILIRCSAARLTAAASQLPEAHGLGDAWQAAR